MSASASQLAIANASPELLRAALGGLLQKYQGLNPGSTSAAPGTAVEGGGKPSDAKPASAADTKGANAPSSPKPDSRGDEDEDGDDIDGEAMEEAEEEEEDRQKKKEEEAENDDDDDDKPSVITPDPRGPSTGPTPPKGENRLALPDKVNSSTHRKEWMLCGRRMEVLSRADFPELHKLWDGSLAAHSRNYVCRAFVM